VVCVNIAKSGIPAMFAIQIDHQEKDVSMVKFHLYALHVMDLGFVSTIRSDQVVEFAGLSLKKNVLMENEKLTVHLVEVEVCASMEKLNTLANNVEKLRSANMESVHTIADIAVLLEYVNTTEDVLHAGTANPSEKGKDVYTANTRTSVTDAKGAGQGSAFTKRSKECVNNAKGLITASHT